MLHFRPRVPPRLKFAVRRLTMVGLIALLFWGAHVGYVVLHHLHGDARGLLLLGTAHTHPEAMRGAPLVEGLGYDGQFFAALATDPFFSRPETAAAMDSAFYRGSRVALPLIAWLFAGGQDRLAVFIYQLLCWVGAALLPWVLARWLEDEGRSPFWAAPAALLAGVLASMYGSLPDGAAMALCAAAIWLYRSRSWGTVPLLVLAALVKETTLFIAAPLALTAVLERRLRAAALIALVPAAAAVSWRAWLLARLGGGLAASGRENFNWPLIWLPEKLSRPLDMSEVAALLALLAATTAAATLLPSVRRWEAPEICFAASVLVALFLSVHVYLPIWFNHSRVLLPIPALAIVVGERRTQAWQRWFFRLLPLLWIVPGLPLLGPWAAAFAVAVALAWWLSKRAAAVFPPAAAG